MKDAVVFNGIHSLDFNDIRGNVMRIPEVVNRIRQAQEIWDRQSPLALDIANFIGSEDRVFLSNLRLKSLAAAIVQAALFDRYMRLAKAPLLLVGPTNDDSAMKVAAKILSFEEMVLSSPALTGLRIPTPTIGVAKEGLPVLSGMALTEYGAYIAKGDTYEVVQSGMMDFAKMVTELSATYGVERFVNVGPGNVLMARKSLPMDFEEVQILESIDLDPLLSWFWAGMRDVKQAVAQ